MAAHVITEPNFDKCVFCDSAENNAPQLGEKYRLRKLVMHFHCVLLAKNSFQRGPDSEGLHGFFYDDIKKLVRKKATVRCEYCNQPGAAMQCNDCRLDFHLPCGIQAGVMSIFKGVYLSYCRDHRPRQIVPVDVLSKAQLDPPICLVCFETVSVDDDFQALWAPCCRKTWYHRPCAESMAMHMGSLFKCAVCSNKQKFRNWMIKHGIHVPQRDASWESDATAYEIFNVRHSRCDVLQCRAPFGRNEDRVGTRWELLLCQSCGSQGTHVACSNLRFLDTDWECNDCKRTDRNVHPEQARDEAISPISTESDVSSVFSDTDVEVVSISSSDSHDSDSLINIDPSDDETEIEIEI